MECSRSAKFCPTVALNNKGKIGATYYYVHFRFDVQGKRPEYKPFRDLRLLPHDGKLV
jgi:hypothetical protein